MDTTVGDPIVGRVLDGRYRVGVRLARGGMATVYEAHDSRLDRTVALKVMHPMLADDDEFVSRFIREAHAAARLSHPNVVAVYDQGADQGHVFLVMELVRGRTLRDLIRELGHLSPRQALDVLEPLLAALGAAHQAGIVHRDVKPENVLLADDNRVKVADFGLARAVSHSAGHTTASGVLMGTVAYLSPEQVERGLATPRSDVYAAGIVFYEMLTGSKPYDGETAIQVAYRHVHEDVPPPSLIRPGLPAELDALVTRATSRNPDARPADARRMLSEVVTARRQLSDSELDSLGAPLVALAGLPEPTLVVPVDGPPPPRTGNAHSRPDDILAGAEGLPARRGDTGELAAPPGRLRRRRSRGPLALVLVLALAVGLSGFAWFYAAVLSRTATPGLIGLTRAAAAAEAREAGLTVRVTGRAFDEVRPAGEVLRTNPGRGTSIDKGGTVGLILSRGPERYPVPDVVGKTEEVARQLLAEQGLQVATPERRYSGKVEEGRVISADPEVGTEVKRDTAVLLVVSRGVEPVGVPNVVGQPVAEAQAALAGAPLRSAVTEKFSGKVPAGVVISQDPTGGTAGKRSVVQLLVSKGPRPVLVPEVVGKPVAEAQQLIDAAGLVPAVSALPGGPGTVLNQDPAGGSMAPRGSTVTIYVF